MIRVKAARSLAAILITVSVVGCSGSSSPRQWGWLGLDSKDVKGVYFAPVDGLTVRAAPSSSAKVVGQLAPYQKVDRTKITDGYALVAASNGSIEGWVVNAKLLWKLPTQPAAGAAKSSKPKDASKPADATPPTPVEEGPPTAAPAETRPATTPPPAKKPDGGHSVFDPY